MPDWVIEGRLSIAFLLGSASLLLLLAAQRTRKRRFLALAGLAFLLFVGYFLLDHAFESPSEQMIRKVREVAADVSANQIDRAFTHVSEHFRRAGFDRGQFRDFATRTRRDNNVTEVVVWDLSVPNPPRMGEGVVEFAFKVRGRWGESPPNYFARVQMGRDTDGEYRIRNYEIFDSLNDHTRPVAIPGWGR